MSARRLSDAAAVPACGLFHIFGGSKGDKSSLQPFRHALHERPEALDAKTFMARIAAVCRIRAGKGKEGFGFLGAFREGKEAFLLTTKDVLFCADDLIGSYADFQSAKGPVGIRLDPSLWRADLSTESFAVMTCKDPRLLEIQPIPICTDWDILAHHAVIVVTVLPSTLIFGSVVQKHGQHVEYIRGWAADTPSAHACVILNAKWEAMGLPVNVPSTAFSVCRGILLHSTQWSHETIGASQSTPYAVIKFVETKLVENKTETKTDVKSRVATAKDKRTTGLKSESMKSSSGLRSESFKNSSRPVFLDEAAIARGSHNPHTPQAEKGSKGSLMRPRRPSLSDSPIEVSYDFANASGSNSRNRSEKGKNVSSPRVYVTGIPISGAGLYHTKYNCSDARNTILLSDASGEGRKPCPICSPSPTPLSFPLDPSSHDRPTPLARSASLAQSLLPKSWGSILSSHLTRSSSLGRRPNAASTSSTSSGTATPVHSAFPASPKTTSTRVFLD